jgi:hypothetical protein
MNCPQSVQLIAKLNLVQKPSKYAVEGTVAHGLLEEYMTGKVSALDLLERVGDVVTEQGFDITIEEEMVNAIFAFHDEVKADEALLTKPAKVSKAAEMRVCATSVDQDLWGTADYILYQPGNKLFVYDFKYGRGKVVEADENKQMALYAIAVLDSVNLPFSTVELVIIQPRQSDGVRRWTTSVAWLRAFAAQAKKAVEETRSPSARLAAGDWCRWCPAASAGCPAQFGLIQQEAQKVFAFPEPRLLPLEKLAAALQYEDAINSWFEGVKVVIREKLEAGEEVPGWKLVQKKTNRKWVNEQDVEAKFAPLIGDRLYEKSILSPSKLEKIVGKDEVAPLTFKPDGGNAIAPTSDKREALSPVERAKEAKAVFGALGEEPQTVASVATDLFDTAPAAPADDLLAELAGPAQVWP